MRATPLHTRFGAKAPQIISAAFGAKAPHSTATLTSVKLYICWGTFQTPRPPHGHPCHNAYAALKKAGYDPEVVKVQGLGVGPLKFTTDGRREVERISGQRVVPVLVTDDGEVIKDSQVIKAWAEAHPTPRGSDPLSAAKA